ncbi:MAG: protein kinase, partial [Deltaproteobacteria bacterium]|nr:protein kinase [Deltaproteobacteria bacterium]
MNCPACDHANIEGARYCAKCGALMPLADTNSADPMIGSTVGGRYRITRLLGEGGMGRVYVGEQQMGTAVRQVAVKTLLQEFSRDPQVQGRFHRECGTVVGLEHANTIKFYDFGTTDSGDLYIAMEFVDGKPLADVINAEGRMMPGRVEHIMKQICGSLNEAHEKGIVHRDLKPENVILTERAGEKDFVKVLDFGIAKRSDAADQAREQKLTQAGMVLGTPPYMSPEQFTGKELDRRSDIYSLGVMAYEMLSGKLPFEANTPWEWATQHMTAQPFPFERTTGEHATHIPQSMKNAIRRALAKNRDERQATAREFYQELSGGGATTGAGAAPPPASAARPGATQMGEPFVPPGHGGGYPTPAGGTVAGSYPDPMAGAAPPGYPTPGAGMPQQSYGPPVGYGAAPGYGPGGGAPSGGEGGKGPLLAIVGVVALAAIGGGVWFMQSHGDDESSSVPAKTDKTSTSTTATADSKPTPSSTASASPSADATALVSAPTAASASAGDASAASTGVTSPPPPSYTAPTNNGLRPPPPPPPP